MRGTLKGIEVERWGGEQAHRMVGSLKPLQDLHASAKELSRPASALAFFFSTVLPRANVTTRYGCRLFTTYLWG
ncbi:MAG: hypothetical protein Nkreftii_000212 [Candidatus Nitrospira kreftii]|uniref:Uncharacterized protein n=1 Tax=Candidatus Nitrospira kreftii TaxID=2652173 RepID=A0A7S8FAU9_9BACT|nr:MAG: hypothetical protein Nkreftii_000212 [Candidatus Nitrospira kreftii]